jgi:hypothetical protein
MKNRKGLSILTSLIAALFILSIFSGIAAAQPSGELAKDNGQYQIKMQRLKVTGEDFGKAKQSMESTIARLRNAGDNKSQEELNLTKDYLEKALDLAIANLEVLKTRAQNQTENGAISVDAISVIDGHIAQFEQMKTNVQNANTKKELSDANKALRSQWNAIRLEIRYYMALILDHNINNFISRVNDNATARMDAAILNMSLQDKNTTKLSTDERNFQNSMNNAENSEQTTAGLLGNPTGFDNNGTVTNNTEAVAFLLQVDKSQKETIKDLKAASRQLIQFVNDYRKLAGNKARVDETGRSDGGTNVKGSRTNTYSGGATTALSGQQERRIKR